ncbi:MAG TPA: hypothetical protein VF584_07265 [Longimicrobium sp.]|jgi:hypothetical protein
MRKMRRSPGEQVLLVLRLAAIGFVCGTSVGILILAGTQLTYGGTLAAEALPFALLVSGFWGGLTGALITPIAWVPVRRIPIGQVISTTAVAATCGGVLAARGVGLFGEAEAALFVVIPGGLAGFATALLWLRMKAR